MELFKVSDNNITGSLPSTMGNWESVLAFEVDGNKLSVAPLPKLPFDGMMSPNCKLLDHFSGSNAFACPWPEGAKQACAKRHGEDDDYNGNWRSITNKDCRRNQSSPVL
jgi:hypothetical protein